MSFLSLAASFTLYLTVEKPAKNLSRLLLEGCHGGLCHEGGNNNSNKMVDISSDGTSRNDLASTLCANMQMVYHKASVLCPRSRRQVNQDKARKARQVLKKYIGVCIYKVYFYRLSLTYFLLAYNCIPLYDTYIRQRSISIFLFVNSHLR